MKKILLLILTWFIFILPAEAEENKTTELAKNAKSAILIEASTGEVIYEKSPDIALPPASMTKVMTLLLTMEAIDEGRLKYDDKVLISKNASSMGGSQIFLEENSKVTVKELIKGMTIASANDAAVAIAEKIGGTEENFINMMNEKAKTLGLKNTTFKNPHGLDADGHVASARDLSIIAKELIKYEEILKYTSTYEEYMTKPNGEKFWLVNTNKLIRFYDGMDGLKTGYTPKAGYGIIATANKNNMRLISVVMKEPTKEDRSTETINMLEYGYSLYGAEILISKNKKLSDIYINNSTKRNYSVYLKDDVKYISKKGTDKVNYDYKIKLDKKKVPLKKGDKVGILKIKINNKNENYDLVIKENVKKSGYFKLLLNNLKDITSGTVSIVGK